MAELGRKEAEQLIKEILTEYARKIRGAKKKEYIADVQPLFSPDINAFYKLVKSEDMDFYIFNRLNDGGIRQLLVGCRRLAKCYELDSYGKIKDFTYEPESPKCRIASDSGGKYTAGGSYTFTLEGKAELGNKWYEPYRVVWHFYRENPGTGKYEETSSKMDEARALADFDTWDRSFLVSEKGRYKVTATIFNQAITTGIRPDIVEVCELYFEAEDDTDAAVANLKDYEKVFRAIRLTNYGDAFESLGKDIAAITLTLVAFVGIGVILKKVPAGKLKPFLIKLAEKLALPELMTFFGTYGDAFDIAAFIVAVCDFYEQATNARNKTQLKEAAKTFERVVEAFGLVAVMGFMDAVGHKMKKADVEKEINDELNDIVGRKITEADKDLLKAKGYEIVKYSDGSLGIRRQKGFADKLDKLSVDKDGIIVRIENKNVAKPPLNAMKGPKYNPCPDSSQYAKNAVEIIENNNQFVWVEEKGRWLSPDGTRQIWFEDGWKYDGGSGVIEEFTILKEYALKESYKTSTTGNRSFMQAHHGIQSFWAENKLKGYYDADKAPALLLRDSFKGTPHEFITNTQKHRDKNVSYFRERANLERDLRSLNVDEKVKQEYLKLVDDYFHSIYKQMQKDNVKDIDKIFDFDFTTHTQLSKGR